MLFEHKEFARAAEQLKKPADDRAKAVTGRINMDRSPLATASRAFTQGSLPAPELEWSVRRGRAGNGSGDEPGAQDDFSAIKVDPEGGVANVYLGLSPSARRSGLSADRPA
jgi:hypothetical protein